MLSVVAGSSESPADSRFQVAGQIAGQEVATTVESPVARYYFEEYLRGDRSDGKLVQTIERALHECDADPYDRAALECLTHGLSTDFATIFFVARLYENSRNRRAQDAFHATLGRLTASQSRSAPATPEAYKEYVLTFVPGYAYKKDRTTGADFAGQRAILSEKGFRTILIETDELGSVERNAELVAGQLNRLAEHEDKIIVVSASKGGPEVALALGEGVSQETSSRVKAWISVGGLLRGSPYADRFLSWPRRWLAGIALAFQGLPSSVIADLSTAVRGAVLARLHMPAHILTLQYVGAPLSGQVARSTRGRYNALRSRGPNDGLTLLSDELVEGGIVITDVGLDHYYRDPAINLKTISLACVVLEQLQQLEMASGLRERPRARPNNSLQRTHSRVTPLQGRRTDRATRRAAKRGR
jgi:hypothetical protein